MLIPMLLICAACITYTFAIWTEQLKGKLNGLVLGLFAIGFTADVTGTAAMFHRTFAKHIPLNAHSYCGICALIIMLIHVLWAITSYSGSQRSAEQFNRFSPYAWCLWMIAFLTGIPAISSHPWLVLVIVWCLFIYGSALVQEHRGEIRVVTVPIRAISEILADRRYHTGKTVIYALCWSIISPIASLIWCLILGFAGIVTLIALSPRTPSK